MERKICLAYNRTFGSLHGLTSHERKHYERAGKENQGCKVANAYPHFSSGRSTGRDRVPVLSDTSAEAPPRVPKDYFNANKDGERLCQQIARAFQALAKRNDNMGSRELAAMLFSPVNFAYQAMATHPTAAAEASNNKRPRSEVEECALDQTIFEYQVEVGAITQRRSKRRKQSRETSLNIAGLVKTSPVSFSRNPTTV